MNLWVFFFATLAMDSPEARAIAYLSEEVPMWSKENGCYSCHNDGDGARALYRARRLGYTVPEPALKDTTEWLTDPDRWESNRGSPAFSDKKLARVQFAAALAESGAEGLDRAAALVAKDQDPDGAWHIDIGVEGGSPTTYGTSVATWLASGITKSARAERWLLTAPLATTPDLAVAILAQTQIPRARSLLLDWQTSDGGWGPRKGVPAEVFDTALAVMALAASGDVDAATRGREWLIANQLPAGGWPATTRPSGGNSYAQHVSTSAWAAMALFATDPERNRR
jgi:squalene cyclase